MASQNRNSHDPRSALEDTAGLTGRGRGRQAVELPEPYNAVMDDYAAVLRSAQLSDQTRRTYASKVRQYLAWIAGADGAAKALEATDARDRAVRDYQTHLQTVLKRKPATINNALAAINDFYVRRGIGPASAERPDLSPSAPKTLSKRAALRFLRSVETCPSARDRAIALVPFYAGARIAEITALNVQDVRLTARKSTLRIYGRAETLREIPIHPQLRRALTDWLDERADRPATESPALFLNQRGTRLSVSAAHNIITTIAHTGRLHDTTAHVLRHTFATRLVRGGTDLMIVAELLGHTRLETTRMYTNRLPCPTHFIKALELLDVDQ